MAKFGTFTPGPCMDHSPGHKHRHSDRNVRPFPQHMYIPDYENPYAIMKGRGKNFLSNSHRWKRHSMLWSTTNRWMGISSLFVLHCFALMSIEPHFNLHLRRLPWFCLTSSDSNEKCASNLAFAGGKVWVTAGEVCNSFRVYSLHLDCLSSLNVGAGSTVVSERGYIMPRGNRWAPRCSRDFCL